MAGICWWTAMGESSVKVPFSTIFVMFTLPLVICCFSQQIDCILFPWKSSRFNWDCIMALNCRTHRHSSIFFEDGIQVFLVTFTDDWSNITWYGSYTQQIERYPFGFLCIHVFEKNIPVHTLSYILSVFAICSSPLKVKEDDEVDKLEININNPKRSKRTYASPSPEVAIKISRSLRVSNIFYTSVHMRLYLDIHNLYGSTKLICTTNTEILK